MKRFFFTGFPGFLGSRLVERLLADEPESGAVCLIQGKFAELAEARRDEIEASVPGGARRIELVEGDITKADLGLAKGRRARLAGEVAGIYHLAAVYDLSVTREVGMAVNVAGTRHVLDFARRCSQLERLDYVSTCYVSGRWAGIFTEDELDKGQSFNNFYEETKFLAEVEVQADREAGLPAAIYRPAIVVGDSETGATQKYDGPYFIIRFILRQPFVAVMPMVGDPTATRVNLVPRDYVVDAIAHLSRREESLGTTFQLADPAPLTVAELVEEIGRVTGRRVLQVPVMKGPTKAALAYLPAARWLTGIPADSVDYFVHPTHYTNHHTAAALAGSGIELPPIRSYLPRLIEFMDEHPRVSSRAMT